MPATTRSQARKRDTENAPPRVAHKRHVFSWMASLLPAAERLWIIILGVFRALLGFIKSLSNTTQIGDYDTTMEVLFDVDDKAGGKREEYRVAKGTLDSGTLYHNLISVNCVNRFPGIMWHSRKRKRILRGLGNGHLVSLGVVKGRWAALKSDSWLGRRVGRMFYESQFHVCENVGDLDILIGRQTMKDYNLPLNFPPGYPGFHPELPAVNKTKNKSDQNTQNKKREQNAADKQKRRKDSKKKDATDKRK